MALTVCATLAFARPASAQSSAKAPANARWEIEVHGGGAFETSSATGTASSPPAGERFITVTGNATRRSSSWYFGDGAVLMNQINSSFGSLITGRITSLDPVLDQPGASRNRGGSFGFRVARAMTPRMSVEFNLDADRRPLKLTDTLMAGVEASRASFIAAWNERTGLIASGGGIVFTNPRVTSTATIDDEQGRQLFTTGALTFNSSIGSRVTTYATIGGGIISNIGGSPSVTLVGNYRFTSANIVAPVPFQVNETDTVTIRIVPTTRHPVVTVFGLGAKIAASSRWGIRADIRAHVSKNTVDVIVEANPQVTTAVPAGLIASGTLPSMQFSNNPSTGRQSTLSGPPIDGFTTFSSSGTSVHVSVSAGYFVRF